MDADFAEKSTIHGINDLVSARTRSERWCWVLVIAISVVILVQQMVMTGLEFRDMPLMTKIRVEMIDRFPDVLYCPKGLPTSMAKMKEFNLTADDIHFLADFFIHNFYDTLRGHLDNLNINEKETRTNVQRAMKKHSLSFVELLDRLTDDVEVFYQTIQTTVQTVRLPIQKKFTYFGICFDMLLSDDFMISAREGYVPVILTLMLPSFKERVPEERLLRSRYDIGKLLIGEERSSYYAQTGSILIRDGMKNVLTVKETRTFHKNVPRSPCLPKRLDEILNQAFTALDAVSFAVQGCGIIMSMNQTDRRMDQFCYYKNSEKWNALIGLYDTHSRQKYLTSGIPCASTEYDCTVQSMPLESSLTVLQLQYQSPTLTIVEQHEVYTWQGFFSNVGGLLSLLCGASILSLVQLSLYVFTSFTKRCAKQQEKPSVDEKQQRELKKPLRADADPWDTDEHVVA